MVEKDYALQRDRQSVRVLSGSFQNFINLITAIMFQQPYVNHPLVLQTFPFFLLK